MERRDRKTKKSAKKKPPRVPIKTYRWEDVRRSRAKGGYPWTYLYKGPYLGVVDPEEYTMEALRKSKSSSTIGRSDGVEIEDITNGYEEKLRAKETNNKDDHSRKQLTPEPLVTQDDSGNEELESEVDREKPEIVALESAESSDNISQYVDKEYKLASNPDLAGKNNIPESEKKTIKEETTPTTSRIDVSQRAKSEEPKRKRKLSIESSYSRISLSKLGVMKKLREARERMKMPKLSFSTSNLKRVRSKKSKSKEKELKKQATETEVPKKKDLSTLIPKNVPSPVYIHIPLKPPSGETDEFSHLEFSDKKEVKPAKPKFSFRSLGERVIQESKSTENVSGSQSKLDSKPEESQTLETASLTDNKRSKEDINKEEPVESKSEKQATSEETTKGKQTKELKKVGPPTTSDKENASKSTEALSSFEPEIKTTPKLGTFKVGSSTESDEPVLTTVHHLSVAKSDSNKDLQRGRARSAEPERKRKRSIDSAYSRISLPKLGFLKRLKDRADKLKLPKLSLSRTNSEKRKEKETKKIKKEPSLPQPKTTQRPKDGKPVYIHIPLKPPPGQTDEFSYLEFEDKRVINDNTDKEESEKTPDTADSTHKSPVQFIILTAPSDDEILDDKPDIPDTPSSDDTKTFFDTKLEKTLKEIAAEAVDKVSPESRRRKLESVSESPEKGSKSSITESDEQNSEAKTNSVGKEEPVPKTHEEKATEKGNSIKEEIKTIEEKVDKVPETIASESSEKDDKEKQPKPQTERIIIDEEDGLKSSEVAKPEETKDEKQKELKSVLKSEGSPVLKKKVSFKRRSKGDTKDGDYEEIKKPEELKEDEKEKTSLATLGTSQSMSVDEEKSYLDQKIIKDTSLEEDYNKWSKSSDHEYEPINPPLEEIKPPTVDTEHKLHHPLTRSSFDNRLTGDELSDEEQLSAQEMQSQLEERFFNPTLPKITEVRKRPASESPEKTKARKPSAGSESAAKIQQAIKTQTDKFKHKLQNIKKPNIKLPARPTFKKPNMQRFKIERPKINLPKMPDAPKIDFKSFSLPRKSKQSLKQRQFSTESNAGDSKRSIFDFSTYPRIFKKKREESFESSSSKNEPDFTTATKTNRNSQQESRKPKESDKWGNRDIIRIPLHSEDSMDMADNDMEREDSVERRMASHTRYDEDIDDIDDAYQRENQEIHQASPFSSNYNTRWTHGTFHPNKDVEDDELNLEEDFGDEDFNDQRNNIKNLDLSNRGLRIEDLTENNNNNNNYKVTDLDSPEFIKGQHDSFDTNNSKDIESSESSFGPHRRGVLEEINSDEFFLRQKGISQDDIDMGRILSSEIREAFRTDINALSQMEYPDNVRASNQSLPEASSKKKSIKKPKRRKTPHASQEHLRYADQESEEEVPMIPPCRPKRRSKKGRKSKPKSEVIPYQETIDVEVISPREELLPPHDASIMSRSDDEHDIHYKAYYENQQMEGKDQPIIQVTDPYKNLRYEIKRYEVSQDFEQPAAPPRRRSRSLKSLSISEHDSILDAAAGMEIEKDIPLQNVEVYKTEHEYIIPIPHSEKDGIDDKAREEFLDRISKEPPIRPIRKRSRTRSLSRTTSHTEEDQISRGEESLVSENQQPCIEEPCVQTICDYMGYAIVDKSKCRDPPLPPPRTTPRKRKPKHGGKFSTVPRFSSEPPERPLRNYSTLGPSQRVGYSEEKENIDISQYIEIEDEHRNLQSGEVIQKMRERPLPPPPRPPRKTKPLRDITSQENIVSDSMKDLSKETHLEETEVSTQTEPLPDDFVCEEVVQEENDRVLTPSKPHTDKKPEEESKVHIERRLITPTHYSYEEETITHGSLVVEPLDGAQILPAEELTKPERIVPVTVEDEGETSEIPEEFKKLRSKPDREITERPSSRGERPSSRGERPSSRGERPPSAASEVDVLRTQKLQVSDLDVDRLTVNELLANKIIVSEIDSNNILANEIGSKSGTLKLGEIELPPGVVQHLFEQLQSVAQEQTTTQKQEEEFHPPEESSVTPQGELSESGQKKNFD